MTTGRRRRLWRRVGLTYLAAGAAIALFVLLAACYRDLEGMTGMALVIPAILSTVAAPLALDLRDGVAAQKAANRMAAGVSAGLGALCLVGLLMDVGVLSRQADVPVLIAVFGFPLNVALWSDLRKPGRLAWVGELAVCLLGGVGWLLILRRAVLVSAVILVGPLPGFTLWNRPMWVPWDLLDHDARGFILMAFALPFAVLLTLRVRRHFGEWCGTITGEVLAGVLLLGWSYRLVGAIGLSVLFMHRLIARSHVVRPWTYALLGLLFLQPVDVSIQRSAAHGCHFLPARGGDYTADALGDPPAHGFVFIAEGFYYSPRWIWVCSPGRPTRG